MELENKDQTKLKFQAFGRTIPSMVWRRIYFERLRNELNILI